MLETLLEVSKTHPSEDVLVHQYVVLGVAKAAAIVGLVSILVHQYVVLGVAKAAAIVGIGQISSQLEFWRSDFGKRNLLFV